MKNWKSLLTDNLGLKLISLTLAFVLWFVVISIDDPVDEKSFNNIEVDFVNTETLTNNNMVYEVLDSTDVVRRITFEAPDSVRKEIEASDFVAEADFANITAAETVEITFSCPKYSSQVTNISGNISFVKLSVEEKAQKWIDIKYNLIGDVADGYLINSTVLNQNRLEVVGPISKIQEISGAFVDINVEGISNDIATSVDIYLVDKDGNVLSYDSVSKSADNVMATVDIYAMKEVPLEFSLGGEVVEGYITTGEPAEGYMTTGVIELNPQTVIIAGNANIVNGITSIVIPAEDIDITDATQDYEFSINLRKYMSNGVVFADKSFDGKVQGTVYIEEITEREVDISDQDFSITNVPDGMIGLYPEELNNPKLSIQGLREHVTAVGNVRGTIDVAAWMAEQGMETLTAGIYELPIEFVLPEEVEQIDSVTVLIEFVTTEQYTTRMASPASL